MANYVILKIMIFLSEKRRLVECVKMNFSVGVTDHVKNSWALPGLFKFG